MIVVLKDNYPCNSINRGRASLVKHPQFLTAYRNAAQFSTIIHFLYTIQLIITPLICSPEHFAAHRGAAVKLFPGHTLLIVRYSFQSLILLGRERRWGHDVSLLGQGTDSSNTNR
jgi:hypothetical protein